MGTNKPLNASTMIAAKKRSIFHFVLLQFLFTIFISLGIFYISGGLNGYSFLLGAWSSILPSIYMAWRVFGYKGVRSAKDVVRSFYRGEAGKLVMTVVLLSLVFLLIKPLSAEAFFAGFGIAILSHWLSPILLKY